MTPTPRGQATRLLRTACTSAGASTSELFAIVYDQMRAIAGRLLAGERKDHTLQPTALVHEAWLSLIDQAALTAGSEPEARRRFVCLATRAMRNILVDHARRHNAARRGGAWNRVEADDLAVLHCDASTVLDLETALTEIERVEPRLAQIAELRVFCGMSTQEIATELGLGTTTVKQDWNLARALLTRRLASLAGTGAAGA